MKSWDYCPNGKLAPAAIAEAWQGYINGATLFLFLISLLSAKCLSK
jgi:hypothetical protein